jgi:hypothetical protein
MNELDIKQAVRVMSLARRLLQNGLQNINILGEIANYVEAHKRLVHG